MKWLCMDIWKKLYLMAKEEYHPESVSPFIEAHHVVCALESENSEIYTGFCIESCSGVLDLCAERVAALKMYLLSGQTKVKRLIRLSGSCALRRRQRHALRCMPRILLSAKRCKRRS